jgi:cell division protein FtsB
MAKRTHWVIGVGVGSLLVILGPGTFELIRLRLQQSRLDRRLAQIQAEHERLTSLEQRLRTDPAYVEGLIRSTFKVSQPGEYVIPLENGDASKKGDVSIFSRTDGDTSLFSRGENGRKKRSAPLQ